MSTVVGERPRRKGGGSGTQQHSRIEQALFRAKNQGSKVKLTLAVETPYTDEDCTVVGYVDQVDKFDVSLDIDNSERKTAKIVWFRKQMIVCTEVL